MKYARGYYGLQDDKTKYSGKVLFKVLEFDGKPSLELTLLDLCLDLLSAQKDFLQSLTKSRQFLVEAQRGRKALSQGVERGRKALSQGVDLVQQQKNKFSENLREQVMSQLSQSSSTGFPGIYYTDPDDDSPYALPVETRKNVENLSVPTTAGIAGNKELMKQLTRRLT